jgi:hypothetical protein
LLNSDQGELPLAIRLESNAFETTKELAFEYLQELIDRVKEEGITPMIATSGNTWPAHDSDFFDWEKYPLWIADYSSVENPQVPAPWKQWTFWNYSEKGDGETFGTESFDVHLISFHGKLSNLLKLIQTTTTLKLAERILNLEQRIQSIDQFVSYLQESVSHPAFENEAAEEGMETPQGYAVCNANSLNVRKGPGLSHQILGTVLHNQRVRVIARQDDWARITEPEGWISEKYLDFE